TPGAASGMACLVPRLNAGNHAGLQQALLAGLRSEVADLVQLLLMFTPSKRTSSAATAARIGSIEVHTVDQPAAHPVDGHVLTGDLLDHPPARPAGQLHPRHRHRLALFDEGHDRAARVPAHPPPLAPADPHRSTEHWHVDQRALSARLGQELGRDYEVVYEP
ncbi:hypothetical protein, partial [Mobilicoccus pelagius]|uniref:hypothetical protein n=1 Tax=Mobilicoccus pelagius TaxID=746032 RepID=UPI00058F10F6